MSVRVRTLRPESAFLPSVMAFPQLFILKIFKYAKNIAGQWWRTPLNSAALSRQRQKDLCEFEASLVYKR